MIGAKVYALAGIKFCLVAAIEDRTSKSDEHQHPNRAGSSSIRAKALS
jgi:hypothetical protein